MSEHNIDQIKSRALILTITLLAIFTFSQIMAMPADANRAAPSERILVSVQTFFTAADGETRSSGSVSLSLIEGETGAAYIACGFFDRNGGIRSLLAMGGVGHLDPASHPPFANLPHQHPTIWGIRCTLMSRQQGEITLDVEWERVEQEKPGAVTRSQKGHRVITLTEEGRHLLDFIGTADGEPDSAGHVNRTVELGVRVAEIPSLAATKIQYDLWLVDEAANGEQISLPLRLIGRQGERLNFSFETIRRPVPGIELDNGSAIETLMEIEGTIRGRIRPDGSIGISLGSGRRFGLAPEGEDSPGWSSDGGGRKHFTLISGETVSTLFPEPVGQSILSRNTSGLPTTSNISPNTLPESKGNRNSESGAPPQGVSVTDTNIRVQFKPFFEGHSISLIISAGSKP